jgi:outer membrane protein TolC
MIADLLEKLRASVNDAEGLSDADRATLLGHINAMEPAAASELPSPEPSALDELRSSLQSFEASHPDLTAQLNTLATTLANIGL